MFSKFINSHRKRLTHHNFGLNKTRFRGGNILQRHRLSSIKTAKLNFLLATLFVCLGFFPVSSQAAICSVDDNGPATYSTIQAAINDVSCNPINIESGSYFENLIISRAVTLNGADPITTIVDGGSLASVVDINVMGGPQVIMTNLTLQNGLADKGAGIYAGTSVELDNMLITQNIATSYGGGIYVFDGPLTLTNSTVIDNEAGTGGGGIDNRYDNSIISNSLILNNRTMNTNINQGGGGINNRSNLTIIDSNVSGNTSAWIGGGISNDTFSPDSLTLTNVIVDGNIAGYQGGGIFNWSEDSVLNIEDSEIINNSVTEATGSGGGIKSEGQTTINGTLISNNSCGWIGGGIEQLGGSLVLTDTDIIDNSCTGGRGGGIFLGDGSLMITNSRIESNIAENGAGLYAGGYNVSPGTSLTLIDTSISENSASSYGGGIFNSVLANFSGSTISANSAGIYGGGIYGYTDDNLISLTNNTLSGNTAIDGAGIYLLSGQATISNTTISNNTADIFKAGGIRAAGMSTVITVRNTIIALQSSGFDCLGNIDSAGYNLESAADCGFSQIGDQQNTDPLLLPLANYGGLTDTHALEVTSPAIDMADPAGCWIDQDADGVLDSLLTNDQRGQARVDIFGVGNESPDEYCDIGAYEFEYAPMPLLFNPSFEADNNGDQLPDQWLYLNFALNDGQDCSYAFSNLCSLIVEGDGQLKKSKQLVNQSGLAGDSYTLTLWSATNNATSGRLRAAIRVKHTDGTTAFHFINLDKGTHDWQQYTLPVITAKDYDSIIVLPLISQLASGTANVDTVSLNRN